ncbi:MAG: enolase C-terminal domain-like protein [Verrucomicrobiales bacterium]|nr:enolase C-terminal domain-like protein [Verrucomicrobiales bacterium]
MKKTRTRWMLNVEKGLRTRCEAIARAFRRVRRPGTTLLRSTLIASTSLLALSILNPEAQAESKPDPIVAADLLTVKEPKSEAESQLRVIRLTTRDGSTGYGDYLDYGLPAEDAEEVLARMVNRYALQNYKPNIFMPDPSMRAVGAGHTVLGETAPDVLNAITPYWPGRALYHREGFGRMWQGPGKSGLVIALQTALLDLAGETGPCQVRLCPSIRIDRKEDGKRRLCTPEEMQQTVASFKEAGFTAVRLELAGALDDEMKARGECAPYRYPQEVLGQIDKLVLGAKKGAGTEMDITVAADRNLSTDGLTYLALRCQRNEVTLLENPMAVRHLIAQGHARKEFRQPLGFGGDYHLLEDFSQGIKHQIGTVLTPDAGHIGGVTMIARTADLAKDAKLKVAPVVQGGPLSLLAVARSLSDRDEALWVTSPYQDEWLKEDGVLKRPLQIAQGSLVTEACEIDEAKFQINRIAELKTKNKEK